MTPGPVAWNHGAKEWTQAKGRDWNAGIEAERNSAGFNIRAAAGLEKNNGNKVAPYGSLEFRKQRGNWEVKGGFIIKKDSKGAILEVRKAF